jgi:hypothetical protein
MNSTRLGARRSRTLGVLMGVGLTFWLTATPAPAQWFGGFEADAPIPPQGIVRMLTARGFSGITRPRFDGEVYRVEGVNRYGERVRLTIDAYDGDIVGRTRLAHAGEPLEDGLIPPRDVGGRIAPEEEPFAALPPPAPAGKPQAPSQQQALRSEPQVRSRPATTQSLPRPSEARPAQPRISPPAPAPVVAAPKPSAPAKDKPTESAGARFAAPVRVIGGVTPLTPDQSGTAKPASPEPAVAAPETPPL